MATVVMVSNKQSVLVDTIEEFYTAPSSDTDKGTKITTYTASNNTTSNKSYKGYIYDSSGALVQAVVPLRKVVRDRFDAGASIVGHVIPKGGSLRFESSAASSISWYVTGEEL